MDPMFLRLEEMLRRFEELYDVLVRPEIMANPREMAKLNKEQAGLRQTVETYKQLKQVLSHIDQAEHMLKEDDAEMKEMAQMELEELLP
ncbi:MAG: PCRF domain-containing protein, partial [Erysipelotrichaceae bacterium]